MNSNQTNSIVQLFFQFLSERKLTDLSNLFSEKVDWYIPGDIDKAPWLGRRNSKEEVKEFYELLWKNTEPISAEVAHIFIDANNAVIAGQFSTRMLQTGKIVDSLFFIQITVENDLITKYLLLEDSYAVSVALTNSLPEEMAFSETAS